VASLGTASALGPARPVAVALTLVALCVAWALASASHAHAASGTSAAALTRACPGADRLPTRTSTARRRLRCVVNAARRAHGRRALRDRPRLRRAANAQARRCASAKRLGHRLGGDLRTRVRRVGYLRGASSFRVAEALGTGTGRRGSAVAAVQAWLRSPPHRAIVLDRSVRDGGFGFTGRSALGSRDGATWALIVGRRG